MYRSRRLARIEAMLVEQRRMQDMQALRQIAEYTREELRCYLDGEPFNMPEPPGLHDPLPEAEGAREELLEKLEDIRRRLEIHGHLLEKTP